MLQMSHFPGYVTSVTFLKKMSKPWKWEREQYKWKYENWILRTWTISDFERRMCSRKPANLRLWDTSLTHWECLSPSLTHWESLSSITYLETGQGQSLRKEGSGIQNNYILEVSHVKSQRSRFHFKFKALRRHQKFETRTLPWKEGDFCNWNYQVWDFSRDFVENSDVGIL